MDIGIYNICLMNYICVIVIRDILLAGLPTASQYVVFDYYVSVIIFRNGNNICDKTGDNVCNVT